MDDEINEYDEYDEYDDENDEGIQSAVMSYENAQKMSNLINELNDLVATSATTLRNYPKIDKDELQGIINDIVNNYPRQFEDAKNVLEHEKRIINEAQAEAKKIVSRAEEEASMLVSTHEIKKRAKIEAEQLEDMIIEKITKMKHDAVDKAVDKIRQAIMELETSLQNFEEESKRINNEIDRTKKGILSEIRSLSDFQRNLNDLIPPD